MCCLASFERYDTIGYGMFQMVDDSKPCSLYSKQGLPQFALLDVLVTGYKWTPLPKSSSGTQWPPLKLCSNNLKSH